MQVENGITVGRGVAHTSTADRSAGTGQDARYYVADIDAQLSAALTTLGVRDAAAKVAAATGVSKRELYSRALELSGRERRAKGRRAP